jgi:hypothetical protein
VLQIAHGLGEVTNLPIPEELFISGAAVVLIVTFLGLAVLWPQPKLEDGPWRPLPLGLGRALTSAPVEILCGAIGLFLLGVVVWSGVSGLQVANANFATVFVYVTFWVGLVPLSVLFGDVFRAFNPWRAAGRAIAWVAQRAAGGSLPAPLQYPDWLGRWPAALGIFLFTTLELVAGNGDLPENVAIAALVYSAFTWIAMALFGVEAWIDRGEAFSVYFNLFSRLSVFERRGGELGLRLPLSGLPSLRPLPGTVPLLAVMIGSVSFDGFSETPPWNDIAPDIARFFEDLNLSPQHALEATFLVGLIGATLVIYCLYRLAMLGVRSVGDGFASGTLAARFIHSLAPIALAYVAAHYLTLLLYDGQRTWSLASNPLGESGTDLFGTAGRPVDYTVIGAKSAWYWQVGFVVLGHIAGLTLAHDRALVMYDKAKLAVRSQYWVLVVMVVFTSLALWLLWKANA